MPSDVNQFALNIKNFDLELNMQMANYMAAQVTNSNKIEKLKQLFSQMDQDGSCMLTKDELFKYYKQVDPTILESTISLMFDRIDIDKDGFCSYTEFLAAASATSMFDQNNKLKKTLRRM